MACYLGHVGIELLEEQKKGLRPRVRFVLSGIVVKHTFEHMWDRDCDNDGAFDLEDIEQLLCRQKQGWEGDPPRGVPDRACRWLNGVKPKH